METKPGRTFTVEHYRGQAALYVFPAESETLVRDAERQAGVSFERIVDPLDVATDGHNEEEQ